MYLKPTREISVIKHTGEEKLCWSLGAVLKKCDGSAHFAEKQWNDWRFLSSVFLLKNTHFSG